MYVNLLNKKNEYIYTEKICKKAYLNFEIVEKIALNRISTQVILIVFLSL